MYQYVVGERGQDGATGLPGAPGISGRPGDKGNTITELIIIIS